MKWITAFLSLFLLMACCGLYAQTGSLRGAWQSANDGQVTVILMQDGYYTETLYTESRFIQSYGGPYSIQGDTIKVALEFHSAHPEETGTTRLLAYAAESSSLQITTPSGETRHYSRVDDGNAPLAGVWKITGRKQDGTITAIHQSGPRKTLKMLTGTRFQWFAINPETKQFSGTGGGTYTFINGKYTEHIGFFSRDDSRTGASLTFDGKIENGQWHHSGLSSKGDPIYEIWSKTDQ